MSKAPVTCTRNKLSWWHIITYGMPGFSDKVFSIPVLGIIPTFYLSNTAVEAAVVGAILMVTRILDAILDPLMGQISDHTRTRFGARKPWILVGGLLTGVASYFLFHPESTSGAIYFSFWLMTAYLGWTMFFIPYSAWGAELSADYHVRSQLATARNSFGKLGLLAYQILPILPFFASAAISPPVVSGIGWLIALSFPITAIISVVFTPIGVLAFKATSHKAGDPAASAFGINFFSGVKYIIRNLPFWRLMLGFCFSNLGIGITTTILLLYMQVYLKIPEKFIFVLLASTIGSLVAMPLWLRIARRIGKHRTWSLGVIGSSLVLPAVAFLEPGPGAFLPMLVIYGISGTCLGAIFCVTEAMVADTIDYDILKSGRAKAATYFAMHFLLTKMVIAVISGAVFVILGAFGLQVRGESSAESLAALYSLFCFAPSVFKLIAVFILWNLPLNARRHATIRKRLERRRSAAVVAGSEVDRLSYTDKEVEQKIYKEADL